MTPLVENITVIGVGKLGLGFALLLERAGYNVIGVDIFPEYVSNLNNKTIDFTEPGYNELLQNATNFKATTNIKEGLDHSDIIFILVQTPNGGGTKFYDHTILSNLLEKINKYRPQNKHFVIGCTVMPHYIDQVGTMLITNCDNCTLNYNPEFIAQGDIVRGFEKPDMILIGSKNIDTLTPIFTDVYTRMTQNEPIFSFMTPLEAEIVKISLNGFVTTKISFANMVSDLCDQAGANKSTVLKAIGADTRIGRKYFNPGLSFGGPCFPRDTKALKQLMDQHGIPSQILQSTTEYNQEHNRRYAEQLVGSNQKLKDYVKAQLDCKEIYNDSGLCGFSFTDVCYKPNVHIPIIEESAKLKIAEILVKDYGRRVIIKDVAALISEVKKEYGNLFEYSEISL
jgi:nucleotide sugar dehydrogenase